MGKFRLAFKRNGENRFKVDKRLFTKNEAFDLEDELKGKFNGVETKVIKSDGLKKLNMQEFDLKKLNLKGL